VYVYVLFTHFYFWCFVSFAQFSFFVWGGAVVVSPVLFLFSVVLFFV